MEFHGKSLSFDLKRLCQETPCIDNRNGSEGNDNDIFGGRLCWRKLTVTVVAVRKDDPLLAPGLIMCNSRIHAVHVDASKKQICYRLCKGHCCKLGRDDDVWISARIFVHASTEVDEPAEFSRIHIKMDGAPQST